MQPPEERTIPVRFRVQPPVSRHWCNSKHTCLPSRKRRSITGMAHHSQKLPKCKSLHTALRRRRFEVQVLAGAPFQSIPPWQRLADDSALAMPAERRCSKYPTCPIHLPSPNVAQTICRLSYPIRNRPKDQHCLSHISSRPWRRPSRHLPRCLS